MNRTKLILFGIGGVIAIIVLVIFFRSIFSPGQQTKNVTLQFWGTFDDATYFAQAIRDYKRLHPNVTIIYRQIPYADYEKTLISSFAAGTGPDIWMMHNTWLPKHLDKITPLPQSGKSALTFKSYQDQFVDTIVLDLTRNSQIYAVPLYVDTLALYYNKDLFNSAGITNPPRTWEDFVKDVGLLTAKDGRGNITKSAAAIGTARNINRSTDILMLLMLQSGAKMTDAANLTATFSRSVENINVGEIAMQFYADFANSAKPDRYTWNDQQKYSIDAFTDGNTAMMFNYSHQIPTIRAKAPRLNFAIAPMPQPAGAQVTVNFANYWAATVSKQSKAPQEAWDFLADFTTTDTIINYLNASDRPAARRDLIEKQKIDPDLGVFATQALSARSWYQADNIAIENIFATLIDDVNFNRASIHDAVRKAEDQVSVIMSKAGQ